eukprot:EG_transcript_60870
MSESPREPGGRRNRGDALCRPLEPPPTRWLARVVRGKERRGHKEGADPLCNKLAKDDSDNIAQPMLDGKEGCCLGQSFWVEVQDLRVGGELLTIQLVFSVDEIP